MLNTNYKHENFVFEDNEGIGEELIVIPYRHFKNNLTWLGCVINENHDLFYTPIVASNAEDAANLARDAYVKDLLITNEMNRLRRDKLFKQKESDATT